MAEERNEQNQIDPKWQAKMEEVEPELMRLDGPLKMANLFASTMANAKNADLKRGFQQQLLNGLKWYSMNGSNLLQVC